MNFLKLVIAQKKRNTNLGICSISEYSKDKDSENILVKIGGEPYLIQDEESYYKELEEHGFSFFLSIDENGYSEDVTIGSYPSDMVLCICISTVQPMK